MLALRSRRRTGATARTSAWLHDLLVPSCHTIAPAASQPTRLARSPARAPMMDSDKRRHEDDGAVSAIYGARIS